MAGPKMQTAESELDTSLVLKCMEFTKQMTDQGNSFKFSMCLPSGFNFSLEFAKGFEKEQPSNISERKKKSPSTIRRNKLRREKYLKRKTVDETPTEEISVPSELKDTPPPPPTKKTVTHDRFKCQQCGEKLDTKNCLSNHMISEHEAEGEIFTCDICDFSTSRKVSLQIHISRKHENIEQLDGHSSSETYDSVYVESSQLDGAGTSTSHRCTFSNDQTFRSLCEWADKYL